MTQLLERAHTKKINKIFLKDADPLLYEYYIDMTNFEQICEPTSETYPVRREYYAHTSPAAKGKYLKILLHFRALKNSGKNYHQSIFTLFF